MHSEDVAKLQCKQIDDPDIPGVVECLAKNFPRRGRAYWRHGLEIMGRRPRVLNCPRYGFLLQAGDRVVGVLLTIYTDLSEGGEGDLRCNLSSWCVDPEYRSFAFVLNRRAVQCKSATYSNISPAPYTWKTIEALGFRRFADLTSIYIPLLSSNARRARLVEFTESASEAGGLSSYERRVLADHKSSGLPALIGVSDSIITPFVLQFRPLWKGMIPCAQVLYCRSYTDLVAFSRPIGRYCALRGRFVLVVSSNGPIPELSGRCFPFREPRYFLGPKRPTPTDFAYTETTIFGP
jgi:hypothetical protein